jgi:hypothetical protein
MRYGKTLISALVTAGVLSPKDAEAMYVGAKPTELGAFSSLMDRMVRKEIPDVGARLYPSEFKNFLNVPDSFIAKGNLGNLYRHPELFNKYPELKNIDTQINLKPKEISSATGDYRSAGDKKFVTIGTGSIDDANKVLLHEIQHAIQEKEGGARGGSPEGLSKEVRELLRGVEGDIWTRQLELKKVTDPARRAFLEKEIGDLNLEARNLTKQMIDASTGYGKLAGEIESRDTAARMGMSGIERSRTAPYSSENIPLSDVIVKGAKPVAYGVGGAGLMSMMGGKAQVGPTIENQRRMMVDKYEGGGLQSSYGPEDLAAAGVTGGGTWLAKLIAALSDAGINAGLNYVTR